MVIKNNKQEELPKKRWLDEKEKEGIVFLRRVKRGGGGGGGAPNAHYGSS